MFRAILLSVFFAVSVPVFAPQRVTIAQFEQILSTQEEASDADRADRLMGLELTERASTPRLLRWEAEFPGTQTQVALMGLADSSAFLAPPPDEQPALPPPDRETQTRILQLSLAYVHDAAPKLPDFFATRETSTLKYRPQFVVGWTGAPIKQPPSTATLKPLRLSSRSSVSVRYESGEEVQTSADKNPNSDENISYTTRGEFGPILYLVLEDALRGSIYWQRWESTPRGVVAVYRYSVPQGQSHYTVILPGPHKPLERQPAYHGEITINPAGGDIVRITVIADMEPDYRLVETSMMVEYGLVVIGEKTYTCPVRAIAFSRSPNDGDPSVWDSENVLMMTRIDDVAFTGYHMFRASSHIVGAAAIPPSDDVPLAEKDTVPAGSTTAPAGGGTSPPPRLR